MQSYKKVLILPSILIFIVFTTCGWTDANIENNTDVQKKLTEENQIPNMKTVEVDADSELGQEILKMDEFIYGEGNKYKEPAFLKEEELIGAWSISGSLIEFYPNGHFQYFMTDVKSPVRCQIGTYTYETMASKEGSNIDSTVFVLNIEHIIIDDKITEIENLVIPYIVTGLKEKDDLAVINLNSIQVSEFDKLSNDLKDPLLKVEDFQDISINEMQKLCEDL